VAKTGGLGRRGVPKVLLFSNNWDQKEAAAEKPVVLPGPGVAEGP